MILIPIKNIKKWENNNELIEFCQHIIDHFWRYEKERIFEAKEIINNLGG